jgi:hypothetical protein
MVPVVNKIDFAVTIYNQRRSLVKMLSYVSFIFSITLINSHYFVMLLPITLLA